MAADPVQELRHVETLGKPRRGGDGSCGLDRWTDISIVLARIRRCGFAQIVDPNPTETHETRTSIAGSNIGAKPVANRDAVLTTAQIERCRSNVRDPGFGREFVSESPRMTGPDPKIEILSRLDLYFSVRHTARTMRLFAEVLDYDYDCVVIFLSVAEVCFQAAFHLAPIEVGPRDIEALYSQVASSGLSVMTIAEITGIPRETVRRKVKKLVDDKHLSISEHTKNVYLPVSVVLSSKFFDRFQSHLSEASQLVKSITYYQK